mgnify:CR=1 FL=1
MYNKEKERGMDFTKLKSVAEIPNLLHVQRYSFEDFLQRQVYPQQRKKEGLQKVFMDAFPVESYNQKLVLEFAGYRFPTHRAAVALHVCATITHVFQALPQDVREQQKPE